MLKISDEFNAANELLQFRDQKSEGLVPQKLQEAEFDKVKNNKTSAAPPEFSRGCFFFFSLMLACPGLSVWMGGRVYAGLEATFFTCSIEQNCERCLNIVSEPKPTLNFFKTVSLIPLLCSVVFMMSFVH